MNVLVIGGAGYIGSHVVKELMANGHKVTVFDNLSSGLRENLFKENDFIYGNILIERDLELAFARGFDAFVHLAAFKAAGESMVEPEKYSINNITGTLNIMNAAVKHNCKIMIFSSSAATFGEPQYLPIDENHPQKPINYYGFTKLEIERFMDWYDKLRGLKFAALRYFNAAGYDPEGIVCGLEQKPENLLPRVMEAALGQRQLKIFGTDYDTRDGTCIRDYIHVTDLARAHVMALDYIAKNGKSLKLNLGTEKGTTVKEIIDAARKITGKPIPAEEAPRRPGDPASLYAKYDLAKELLGWEPKYSDVDTLVSTTWKAYTKSN
ncbi:UDP-glucose 4-epimerase GalE [uncultured Treponema sp.]|uniref:UDP-glucose 4-epimerase GalE n=1 Tax=uncultured Treponema sp. TaxID=162155 RepID=UPI0025CDC29A|nr:UDP-glucose 4-epimerase GalE [uncultured Treponema sp.]